MGERLSPTVAGSLGWYVYLYVDPRDERVFYVGKGRGSRCLHHLTARGSSSKARAIRAIRRAGQELRVDILAHALPDEATAHRLEAAVIDLLRQELTNIVRGQDATDRGRSPLADLRARYTRKPATVTEPALLIRIPKRYREGMPAHALYEATRGVWRVDPARVRRARYAMPVVHGVVREVYRIAAWYPAGSTRYETRHDGKRLAGGSSLGDSRP
jgi:hypothetical protein